jgi:hypothetical protein
MSIMTPLPAKVTAIDKSGAQYQAIVEISPKYRGSFNTLVFGEIKPHNGSLKDGRLNLEGSRSVLRKRTFQAEKCRNTCGWRLRARKVGRPNPRFYLFAKSLSLAQGYQTNYRFVSPRSP